MCGIDPFFMASVHVHLLERELELRKELTQSYERLEAVLQRLEQLGKPATGEEK